MEDLKKYLATPAKERDYYEGVKLYHKYGSDMALKNRVFTRGHFQGNKDTLNYELEKIVSSQQSAVSSQQKKVFAAPVEKKIISDNKILTEKPKAEKKKRESNNSRQNRKGK